VSADAVGIGPYICRVGHPADCYISIGLGDHLGFAVEPVLCRRFGLQVAGGGAGAGVRDGVHSGAILRWSRTTASA
jgi:hypothetical protein